MNDDTRRLRIEANAKQIDALFEEMEALHTRASRLMDENRALLEEVWLHVDAC